MTPEQRIAELEAEVARLRSELAVYRQQEKSRRRSPYHARRWALIRAGKWQPYAAAGPVRDHIRAVMAATGMSRYQFAAAAGLHESTVSKILYDEGRGRVLASVAARARSVTASTPVPDAGFVSPAGSCRRLQALAYAGWSTDLLAARLGAHSSTVRKIRDGDREKVAAATAREVRALYDTLWNTAPPESTRAERIAASKTRNYARKHGWAPAGAWDEDAIDNPDATPAEDWERRRLAVPEIAAEARDLARLGAGPEEQARRIGVSGRTIERALAACPEGGEAA